MWGASPFGVGGRGVSPHRRTATVEIAAQNTCAILRWFHCVDMINGGVLENPPYAKRDRSCFAGIANVIGTVGFFMG